MHKIVSWTNTSQLLVLLNLSLKHLHVALCMQYSSYQGFIGSKEGDSMQVLYIAKSKRGNSMLQTQLLVVMLMYCQPT